MVDNGDKPATKADLQTVRSELKEDIKTQGQMQQIEERLNAKMDTRFNQVLGAIDSFAKKSENYDKAVTLHGPILTEVQVGLKDHEKRIKILETHRR